MLKKLAYILLFLVSANTFATHVRSGEIIYTHVVGTTYRFSVTTFTKDSSPADRPKIPINWGSVAGFDSLSRVSTTLLGNDIKKNVYVGLHTFPGASPSVYTISVEDPNRVNGIINIPNSVNVVFYLQTELFINPFLGINNSPLFDECAIDIACVNNLFSYNSGAVDPDGDSLYYTLQQPLKEGGQLIPSYIFPQASNSFIIDSSTGVVTWDTPIVIGEYSFAVLVEEFRNGQKIGSVFRELQIIVEASCFSSLTCANTVGVEHQQRESIVTSVYPNPTIGKFTIELDEDVKEYDISVINSLGAIINPKIIQKNSKVEVDLNSLSKGVYLIRGTINNQKVLHKVIKK